MMDKATIMMKRMRRWWVVAAIPSIGVAHALPVPGQGTWERTLEGRDINGRAVAPSSASAVFLYDNVLDVTWLRNANVKGQMDWDTAMAWANDLVVGSFSDWRLPTMMDTGEPGCDFSYSGTDCGFNMQTKSGATTYSEMAHLWYVALGNKAFFDVNGVGPQAGWGLSNTATFQNMQADSTRGY